MIQDWKLGSLIVDSMTRHPERWDFGTCMSRAVNGTICVSNHYYQPMAITVTDIDPNGPCKRHRLKLGFLSRWRITRAWKVYMASQEPPRMPDAVIRSEIKKRLTVAV